MGKMPLLHWRRAMLHRDLWFCKGKCDVHRNMLSYTATLLLNHRGDAMLYRVGAICFMEKSISHHGTVSGMKAPCVIEEMT